MFGFDVDLSGDLTKVGDWIQLHPFLGPWTGMMIVQLTVDNIFHMLPARNFNIQSVKYYKKSPSVYQ